MSLNAHRRRDYERAARTRVWLDGVEVTRWTYYADRRRGCVRMYARDETGQYVIDTKACALLTVEKRGRVRIVTSRATDTTSAGVTRDSSRESA